MEIPFFTSGAVRSTTTPATTGLPLVRQSAPALQLSGSELRRRVWHMTPGAAPFILASIEDQRPVPFAFLVVIGCGATLLTMAAMWNYRAIAREGESNWTLNAMSFIAISLPLLFLFPAHPELAAVVITILAIGDGSATLFGLSLGGRRLPWNSAKTWTGFIGFFVAAWPLAALAYWTVAQPTVPMSLAFVCVLPAVIFAQLVESMPRSGTDNLHVGGAAIIGVMLAHTALVGWP